MKKGKFIKNWKSRWFVLKPDGLYYHENPKVWTPIGSIPIGAITGVKSLAEEDTNPTKLPESVQYHFHFLITTPQREYQCAASSQEERYEWVSLMEEAMEMRRIENEK